MGAAVRVRRGATMMAEVGFGHLLVARPDDLDVGILAGIGDGLLFLGDGNLLAGRCRGIAGFRSGAGGHLLCRWHSHHQNRLAGEGIGGAYGPYREGHEGKPGRPRRDRQKPWPPEPESLPNTASFQWLAKFIPGHETSIGWWRLILELLF